MQLQLQYVPRGNNYPVKESLNLELYDDTLLSVGGGLCPYVICLRLILYEMAMQHKSKQIDFLKINASCQSIKPVGGTMMNHV